MLCEKCEDFWRVVEKKILDSGTLSVSESHVEFLWPSHSTILHRSLAELAKTAEKRCHICRILSHTSNSLERADLLSQTAGVHMVLDLEARFGGASALLSGKFYRGDDLERKGRPLCTRSVGICEGLLEDEDVRAVLGRCSVLECGSTGSTAALELASFWLNRCLSRHEKCLNTTRSPNFLPTRLLDVGSERVKLVELGMEAASTGDTKYFALSHCWGTSQIITTNRNNFADHLEDIPFEKLSKTFQEAVLTTRFLSYRYLWIDSLCIIQGDKEDWAREAAQMCDVYRNATMTIAAAHASGGTIGCFYETDNLLRLPVVVSLNLGISMAPQGAAFQGWDRRPPVELRDYEGPPLFDRAWVLQEQLLSTRMLNFDGPMLRWNCLQDEGSTQSITHDESVIDPFYEAIRNTSSDHRDFFASPDATRNWYAAVQEYTHRGTTVASDRLIALAGIAAALARTTPSTYLSGLWTNDLHSGLLWHIAHADVQTDASTVRIHHTSRPHAVRHHAPLAPSWSWASVTAPVMYPPLGP